MPISFEPGAPVPSGFIPLCVPSLTGNEWKYVKECLDTNFISSVGPFVNRFESMVSKYVGTKHAVATINGTSALHTTLSIVGVEPNDEVLVPTLTFISPVNTIRYIGAWPIFIDADPDYWQMDSQKVVDFLEKECQWNGKELRNKTTGRRVKAVVLVHILGHPVDIDPILEVAHKYGLVVIEDAAESLGARYKGRMVGHLGDIACLSFNGNKIITTGGGGMIITDNDEWAQRAKYMITQAKDDPIEYIHKEIGYNYRLTSIQAAVGCAQMEILGKHIEVKRKIASRYMKAVREINGINPMKEASWAFSTFWLFTILVNEAKYGMDSRGLLRKLGENRIQSRPLWQPMHKSEAHFGAQAYKIEVADWIHKRALSIPSSVGLDKESQNLVIDAILNIKNH